MVYYESVMLTGIYQKSEDTHHGVILNIMEQLKTQEWKEIAISYILLLRLVEIEKERRKNNPSSSSVASTPSSIPTTSSSSEDVRETKKGHKMSSFLSKVKDEVVELSHNSAAAVTATTDLLKKGVGVAEEAAEKFGLNWEEIGIKQEEMDSACENFLSSHSKFKVDFEIDDAINKLIGYGLAKSIYDENSKKVYVPFSLDVAIQKLKEKWIQALI